MRRTCASSTAGLPQRAGLGDAHQLGIGHARPEKIREPRRQLDVADRILVRRRARRAAAAAADVGIAQARCAVARRAGSSDDSADAAFSDSPRCGTGNSATRESPEAPGGCPPRTYRLPSAPARRDRASTSAPRPSPAGGMRAPSGCSESSARTARVFWLQMKIFL